MPSHRAHFRFARFIALIPSGLTSKLGFSLPPNMPFFPPHWPPDEFVFLGRSDFDAGEGVSPNHDCAGHIDLRVSGGDGFSVVILTMVTRGHCLRWKLCSS